MYENQEILGIDIGGTGIKGALVDITTGRLTHKRYRIPTPQPSRPDAVAEAIHQIIKHFNWTGLAGCGFPSIVSAGRAMAHSNLHDSWTGIQIDEFLQDNCHVPFTVMNDADAAGIAEMAFGAGSGEQGLVIVITIGTGLGSGVFFNGRLIPNFELGHLTDPRGKIWESYASNSARKREGLSFEDWGYRLNEYLHHLKRLFSPDLFILGGGASKKIDQYIHTLTVDVPIRTATTRNDAGIIGAAMGAVQTE